MSNETQDENFILARFSMLPEWLGATDQLPQGKWNESASWYVIWEQFWTATIVQLFLFIVFNLYRPYHTGFMFKRGFMYDFVMHWIGRSEHPAGAVKFQAVIYFLQLIASAVTMVVWIVRTYTQATRGAVTDLVEEASCAYVMLFYFYNGLRYAGDPWQPFTLGALIDVYTSVPVMMRMSGMTHSWLDFGYLRAYRVLQAYERLEKTGLLERGGVGEYEKELFHVACRTVCLVTCFAGTTFTLEVLGDIDGFVDTTITTGMGDISFSTMFYWIITTISTVGYGDFSPTTVVSRMAVVCFIVYGVIFFSNEIGRLLDLGEYMRNGRGTYHLSRHARHHIVVSGGACKTRTEVLDSFLAEILHSEHSSAWCLDVVVLSTAPLDTDLQYLLAEEHIDGRVQYFRGSALRRRDRERVKLNEAVMFFVLADTNVANPIMEDDENIIQAVAMMRAQPRCPFRLMLVRPQARMKAMSVGIPVTSCYSLNALKINLLAQSCRMPGFTTLLSNLVSSTRNVVKEPVSNDDVCAPDAHWLLQYMQGDDQEVRGTLLQDRFLERRFTDVALEIYFECEVLLIGCQPRCGEHIELWPTSRKLQGDDVCFVISRNEDALRRISRAAESTEQWQERYLNNLLDANRKDSGTHGMSVGYGNNARVTPDDQAEQMEGVTHEVRATVGAAADSLTAAATTVLEPLSKGLSRSPSLRVAPAERADPVQARPTTPTAFGDFAGSLGSPRSKTSLKERHPPYKLDTLQIRDSTRADINPVRFQGTSLSKMLMQDEFEDDDEEAKPVDPNRMRRRGSEIGRAGEHILLLGTSTGMWQVVVAFLRPLRADYLPKVYPVVVIIAEAAPRELSRLFPDVAFIKKDPSSLKVLEEYGLQSAARVILLGGKPHGNQERVMADAQILLVANTLETYLANNPPDQIKHKIANADFFSVYELQDDDNAYMLPPIPSAPDHLAQGVQAKYAKWAADLQDMKTKDSFKYHPRTVCGSLIASNNLSCLYAWSFYTPGIMEIFVSMVFPSQTNQSVMPWRIRVPPSLVGSTYGDLLRLLINAELSPMAYTTEENSEHDADAERRETLEAIRRKNLGNIEEEGTGYAWEDMACLPLGLFRAAGGIHGSCLGYVWTNPTPQAILDEDDFVYVLGKLEFGNLFKFALG